MTQTLSALHRSILILLLSSSIVSGIVFYQIGVLHGRDQMTNDDMSGEMYESNQDDREDCANKSKHPAAFMAGFDYAVQEMQNLEGASNGK